MGYGTPAGWLPDPTGKQELRYWDGAQWTDHVASDGATGTDPYVPPPVPRPPQTSNTAAAPAGRIFTPGLLVEVLAVIAGLALGLVALGIVVLLWFVHPAIALAVIAGMLLTWRLW